MNEIVLVTGADGFIGSHLTEELVRAGKKVRAFCFYNSFNTWGWIDALPEDVKRELDVFCGDVRDPNGVREAMKGVDTVYHLAALIAIPFSYHSPDSYVDTNIKGTLNVLQAANALGTRRVLVTSTSEVYGTAQYVPIDEKHPYQGQSPYSATKIGADRIAESFYRSFQTPVTIVRPFNTYGPRQSARAVIPTIVSQLLGGLYGAGRVRGGRGAGGQYRDGRRDLHRRAGERAHRPDQPRRKDRLRRAAPAPGKERGQPPFGRQHEDKGAYGLGAEIRPQSGPCRNHRVDPRQPF